MEEFFVQKRDKIKSICSGKKIVFVLFTVTSINTLKMFDVHLSRQDNKKNPEGEKNNI